MIQNARTLISTNDSRWVFTCTNEVEWKKKGKNIYTTHSEKKQPYTTTQHKRGAIVNLTQAHAVKKGTYHPTEALAVQRDAGSKEGWLKIELMKSVGYGIGTWIVLEKVDFCGGQRGRRRRSRAKHRWGRLHKAGFAAFGALINEIKFAPADSHTHNSMSNINCHRVK